MDIIGYVLCIHWTRTQSFRAKSSDYPPCQRGMRIGTFCHNFDFFNLPFRQGSARLPILKGLDDAMFNVVEHDIRDDNEHGDRRSPQDHA